MKIKIIAIALLFLGGCTSYTWKHPQLGQTRLVQDQYECDRDADMRVAGYGRIGVVERGYYLSTFKWDCFQAKGYQRVPED